MTVTDIRAPQETATAAAIAAEEAHTARNYAPLPVVAASARGAWITDVEGKRYLDCLAAYSAVNFGHHNDQIVAAAHRQLDRLTLVSRAFHSDRLGPFCADLAALCGKDMVLPMNSGAEAVESGIKVAASGVPTSRACPRAWPTSSWPTTTFMAAPSASSVFPPMARPATDSALSHRDSVRRLSAMPRRWRPRSMSTRSRCSSSPSRARPESSSPDDYLPRLREVCSRRNVLLIADEIQSGLARTGRTFACDHWGVVPDIYLLGKALGGGVIPLSAVVANRDILGVLNPGEHGSTFGETRWLAIGTEVVEILRRGEFQDRSAHLGERLHARLRSLIGRGVLDVRGMGLWAGVDIDERLGTGKQLSRALARRGVLVKDTHGSTLRFAPPLVITADEIDWAVDQLADVLGEMHN